MGSRQPIFRTARRTIADEVRQRFPNTSSIGARVALSAAFSLAGSQGADAAGIFVVNNNADSGMGSLREAIGLANGSPNNVVQFNPSLKGSTITLTTGEIEITKPMTIAGLGANLLTISGGHHSRIFYVHVGSSPTYSTIEDLTLTAGNAAGYGGTILVLDSSLIVQRATISDSAASVGGGVFAQGAAFHMYSSLVTGNMAQLRGGGLGVNYSSIKILGSTISANTAGEYGGGIFAKAYLDFKSVLIGKSTISGNRVPQPGESVNQGGGGIVLRGNRFLGAIYNTTVAQNYAYQNGAGIALLNSGPTGNVSILFTTISGNYSAASAGNGITVTGEALHLSSSIVAGNFSRNGDSDLSGAFELFSSLIKSPDSATFTPNSAGNFFLFDAQLSALADHGGPTRTMLPLPGSKALDAGGVCDTSSTDQRGFVRCVKGESDMGAVERQNPEDIIFRDGFNSS